MVVRAHYRHDAGQYHAAVDGESVPTTAAPTLEMTRAATRSRLYWRYGCRPESHGIEWLGGNGSWAELFEL